MTRMDVVNQLQRATHEVRVAIERLEQAHALFSRSALTRTRSASGTRRSHSPSGCCWSWSRSRGPS
jgi:hypothetical protein